VYGALMELMDRMGWVFGNSLGEVGRSFLVLLDSRWGTTPRLVFGMPSDVGSNPLRECIRSCLALPASMADHLQLSNGSSQLNVNFVRAMHDWELEFFTSFFDKLYSIKLRQNGIDKLYWIPSKIGRFEVRTFYNVLIPDDNTPFPWRCIWRSRAFLRVALVAWLAALSKILTLDNLKK
jgi:hypothetical protein